MKNKVKRTQNTKQQQQQHGGIKTNTEKKTQVEIKKWNDVNKNNEINKFKKPKRMKNPKTETPRRTFWVIYNANNCLAPPPESKSEEKSVISF